jgi:DtxR family Mn-dependent transcriptional regulator
VDHQLTPAQEHYIAHVHLLSREGPVRVGDLAAKLGVRPPSVSRVIGNLREFGLVRHESYGRIELTPAGEAAGRAVVWRSQCLSRLLVEVLAMDPAAAAPLVDRLEHVVGDDLAMRLETLTDFALSSDAWIKRLRHRLHSRRLPTGDSADRPADSDRHGLIRRGAISTD